MNRDNSLEALGFFFLGLAVLIYVGLVVALVYYTIVAIGLFLRYRRYRKLALERFDYERYRLGYYDDVDSVFEAWFPGINVSGDYTHPGWRSGIYFGREYIDEESA